MITVDVGQIRHLAALIARNIHAILQQDVFAGERAGLVHAKHVHAAETRHGIDIFDDGLFAAHGKAAPCKAGCYDHGQHLRHKSNSHRKGKGKGMEQAAPCDSQQHRVAHHQSLYRDLGEPAFSPYSNALVDPPVELESGIFGTKLLDEPDSPAYEDRGKDHDGGGGISGKVRQQQNICDQ